MGIVRIPCLGMSEIRMNSLTFAFVYIKESYDRFWDSVSVEITLYNSGERKERTEGLAEGMAKGRAEERRLLVRKMKAMNMSLTETSELTGLTEEELEQDLL